MFDLLYDAVASNDAEVDRVSEVVAMETNTLTHKKYLEIDAWIDETYGFFSYFSIRSLVASASDNTLSRDYPQCPYSAREILLWAKRNDDESILMTAGGQAISGQGFAHNLLGAPTIDPLTGKLNPLSDRIGILGKSATGLILLAGVAGAGYLFLKPFIEQKARNLAK